MLADGTVTLEKIADKKIKEVPDCREQKRTE